MKVFEVTEIIPGERFLRKLDKMLEAATSKDAEALKQAVIDFQKKAGIAADGKVGPETKKAFAAAMANTAEPEPETDGAPGDAQAGTDGAADAAAQAPAQPNAQAGTDGAADAAAQAPAQPNAQAGTDEPADAAAQAPAAQPAAPAQAPAQPNAPTAGPDDGSRAGQQPAGGTQVSNQKSSTTKQGNTTTTKSSATLKGLDIAAARKTPEYQEIYKQQSGRNQVIKRKAADMKYRSAVASGKIKPPARTASAPKSQADIDRATAVNNSEFESIQEMTAGGTGAGSIAGAFAGGGNGFVNGGPGTIQRVTTKPKPKKKKKPSKNT